LVFFFISVLLLDKDNKFIDILSVIFVGYAVMSTVAVRLPRGKINAESIMI
jgi:hypothetical protein